VRASAARNRTAIYIVDGYNVVRRVTRFRTEERLHGLEAGRVALLDCISSSGLLRNKRVILIFDGAEGTPTSRLSLRGIEVRFSRPPQNADQAILSDLRSRTDTSIVAVVTGDLDLVWETRKLGAQVIDPFDWIRSVSPDSQAMTGSGIEETDKPESTAEETKKWLRIFGDDSVVVSNTPKSANSPKTTTVRHVEKDRLKERRRKRYLRRIDRKR
jgi:predicted RNA-binding protein with PIN domain